MSTKSTIDNDMLVQSNLEAIASGGEEVVPALKALMRLAMRIRGHWMPRGTLSVPASSSDLAPQVSAELQVHVEEVLLRRLRDTDIKGSEEEQIYVINTLAQWGGAKAADELSERIFTGNQDSKVAGQIFVALGILGGSQSSTALVFGLFFATTKSSDIRWNLMQLMCGGSPDLSQSETVCDDESLLTLFSCVDWNRCFSAQPLQDQSVDISNFIANIPSLSSYTFAAEQLILVAMNTEWPIAEFSKLLKPKSYAWLLQEDVLPNRRTLRELPPDPWVASYLSELLKSASIKSTAEMMAMAMLPLVETKLDVQNLAHSERISLRDAIVANVICVAAAKIANALFKVEARVRGSRVELSFWMQESGERIHDLCNIARNAKWDVAPQKSGQILLTSS